MYTDVQSGRRSSCANTAPALRRCTAGVIDAIEAYGKSRRAAITVALTLVAACALNGLSFAQTAAAPMGEVTGLEEIVVTAQKRDERLQDVPLSVQAFSSAHLTNAGVTSMSDLPLVTTGLVFNQVANVGSPYLRGVGSNLFDPTSESPVAVYVDGVYIAAPESNLFSLDNIKQVEVLKGPQGTLFGRNTTGGVIQVETLDPSHQASLDLSATYANYDYVGVSGYGTAGLTDNVAVDLSASYENQRLGWGHNLFNGNPTYQQARGNYSLRNKWLVDLPTNTTLRLTADYASLTNTDAYQKPQGTTSPLDGSGYPGRYNSDADVNDRNRVDTGGVSLRADQAAGPVDIVSISAYRFTRVRYDLDEDISVVPAADVLLFPRANNMSQEIQIKSHADTAIQWIAGSYYYNAKGSYDPFLLDGAVALPFDQQHTKSISGFGQGTLKVLDATDITAGLRYTDEKQYFTFPAGGLDLAQSVDKLTYRVAVDQHFAPDIVGYVSYNTGFKSGGYNLLMPGNTFRPEELDAAEIGLKTVLFDHKLRLNTAAFYYDYQNLQISTAVLGGVSVFNAARAHISGAEGDFELAVAQGLDITGGISYLHGRYVDYPDQVSQNSNGVASPPASAVGNTTLASPTILTNLGATYRVQTGVGEFSPTISAQYNSGFYWDTANRLTQPSYTLINASVAWVPVGSRFRANVWIKNLTDATYYITRQTVAFPIGDAQQQAPPRTFGVTLGVHFE